MKKYDQCLSVSKNNYKYLSLSEKRAKGKLPEMEVAKAYTMFLKKKINDRSTLLDVGCLGEHFLYYFRKRINKNFH